MSVVVLCGGVGAARFLRALHDVHPADDTIAVVNTGDDTVLHGLDISPDIDTVIYTLAGAIDPERGWGLQGETWGAMDALQRFQTVRPPDSSAAPTWFNLGDRDLATHFYRTARRREGATLHEITAEIASAWGLAQRVVPMSDDRISTKVAIVDDDGVVREVEFQDYFVRLRHSVPVRSIRFEGAAAARPTPGVLDAIAGAERIVIAPSNPLVSIGPVRAVPGIDDALQRRRDAVVAVSPIVGGAALKGPADRMLSELGHESTVVGVARLYAPIASTLVIDPVDEHLAPQVEACGIRALVAPSVMKDPEIARRLARATIA